LSKKDQKTMYRASALDSYSKVDVETKTTAENPHHLISLLFEKGCVLLRQSTEHLKRDDTDGFYNATSHAMQIVVGLRGILDIEKGGDLAAQLYETYTAIGLSLSKARNDKDLAAIEKLYTALNELRDGWEAIK